MIIYKTNKIIKSVLSLILMWLSISVTAIERVTYYHNDALGSPVAATNKDGNLLWREAYKPYGERIKDEAAGSNNRWFTGKQEESDFGISYFGARWYDSNTGRFMGIDPVGYTSKNDIMSFNRYLYANNNPYKYVDPNGEFIFTAIAIASFAYSAYDGYQSGGASGAIAEASGFNDAVAGYNSIKNGDVSGAAWSILGIACKSCKAAKKVSKEIRISRKKYGDATDHIADAQKAGHPSVLTIARDGASSNRKASIGGMPKVPGKQLDEYPPAMFREGGKGASVRAISSKNNMGAGACIGNACRGLANGDKVKIKVVE
ncbi:MAG: hypothetical protein GY941_21195 [Planctomycetes bacterium]|nr:hypothetical protein [Planctomycetota bacterium]